MSKEDFLIKLKDSGYNADMAGSIPTVYTENIDDAKSVSKFARLSGYNYSFGVKLLQKSSQA